MLNLPKEITPEILQAFFANIAEGMEEPKEKRGVIYVRKSRMENDKSHYSPQIQEKECRDLAEREGISVKDVIEDLDETGKNSDRPGLQKILRMVKAGEVDYVIVQYLDRNYRNGFGTLYWLNTLQKYQVGFLSASEKIDTRTYEGRLNLFIKAIMAEAPVHHSSERGRRAAKERREEGLHRGGYRLGYCNGLCQKCTDPNGKGYCPFYGNSVRPESEIGRIQVPHPVEKHAVRLIVYSYNEGMSGSEIADYLNKNEFLLAEFGEKKIKFRTKGVANSKAPGKFSPEAVMAIVKNIFYVGYVAHYHTPHLSMQDDLENPRSIRQTRKRRHIPEEVYRGQHDALYPYSIWEENQQIKASRYTTPTSKSQKKRIYPLSGLVQCWECLPYTQPDRTATLRGSTNGSKKRIYRCANLHGKAKPNIVTSKDFGLSSKKDENHIDLRKLHKHSTLPAEKLEEVVDEILLHLTIPEAWFENILAYTFHEDGMGDYHRKNYNLRAALKKKVALYEEGLIDIAQLKSEKLRIAAALNMLNPVKSPQASIFLDLLQDFASLWQKTTSAEKRILLQIIFERIYFDSYGNLREARPHAPFDHLLVLR